MSVKLDFKLVILSPKTHYKEPIHFEFDTLGWYIQHEHTRGCCKPNGEPTLYDIFMKLGINYPEDMKSDIQVLWYRYKAGALTAKQVEKILIRLAEWLEIGNPVDIWDYSHS